MASGVTSGAVPELGGSAATSGRGRWGGSVQTAVRWRDPHRELVSDEVAVGAARLALTLMVLASLAIVSLAARGASWLSPIAARSSFPSWIAGPLGPLTRGLSLRATNINLVFGVLAGGMYVGYLVVVLVAPRLRARWVLGAVVLLHIVFFLAPPMQLNDIFNYINYARMEVVHGLNPYTTIPALGPSSDPTFNLSNWHGLLSPYGPLFTLFTLALVPAGVVASFWALKGMLMLLSLGIVWLVWRCAELLGRDPLRAALFVGLNPIVLIWGLGGDHNDFFMMFLLVLATYLLLRAQSERVGLRYPARAPAADSISGRLAATGRRALGWVDGTPRPLADGEPGPYREFGAGAAIAAAVAIKASAGILAPIFLLGAARRLRLALGLLIGLLAATAATLLAFGVNLPNLAQQSSLVVQNGIPNLVGYLSGAGGETGGLHRLFMLALALGAVGCAVWAARTRDWIAACGGAALVTLLTLSWMLPSYLLWVLPFAALARGRWLRIATVIFAVYVFIFWMPYTAALERFLHIHLATTAVGRAAGNYQNSLEF
jgi:alpha-1,6-mannosyltransferase